MINLSVELFLKTIQFMIYIVTNHYIIFVKYMIILVVKYVIWISLLKLPEQAG